MRRLNAPSGTPLTPAKRANGYACACKECGRAFTASQKTAEFCGTPCRMTFNNRRRDRGADVYDLFMAHRYDRTAAGALKVLTKLNRLAAHFRDEDITQRAGRPSYHAPARVLARHPYLEAETLQKPRKPRK